MKFVSTRSDGKGREEDRLTFEQALFTGYADDGGLLVRKYSILIQSIYIYR